MGLGLHGVQPSILDKHPILVTILVYGLQYTILGIN